MTDIAAHHASGAAPRIGFREIAPATRTRPAAPLCLFGPAGSAVHEELFGETALGAVGCYTIEGATLAPTGIAMKDGVAFSSAAFIHPPHHVATVAGRLRAARLPERHVRGPLAVIYGPGHETYGHWLVDFLPRLWVLAQAGFDILTTRFAVPPDLAPFASRLLARAGIRDSQLVRYRYWHEILRTDLLVMPTGLRTGNRLSPLLAPATAFWTAGLQREAAGLPDLVLSGGGGGGGGGRARRIFVSRAQAPAGRVLTNRAAIEAVAAERGFALIHPQSMPLAAQVACFAGARIIAGEYGSALHGAVFAAAGATTVAVRGAARHPSFVQSGVAAAMGQQVAYVLGRTEGEVEQRFTIRPEEFERALDVAELATNGPVAPRLATTGLVTTGLATTGLATTGLATTGLATTGLATTGLATTGRAPTGLAAPAAAATGRAPTKPAASLRAAAKPAAPKPAVTRPSPTGAAATEIAPAEPAPAEPAPAEPAPAGLAPDELAPEGTRP